MLRLHKGNSGDSFNDTVSNFGLSDSSSRIGVSHPFQFLKRGGGDLVAFDTPSYRTINPYLADDR